MVTYNFTCKFTIKVAITHSEVHLHHIITDRINQRRMLYVTLKNHSIKEWFSNFRSIAPFYFISTFFSLIFIIIASFAIFPVFLFEEFINFIDSVYYFLATTSSNSSDISGN